MNKRLCWCVGLMAIMIAEPVFAQLPANPWDAAGFEKAIKTKQQAEGGVAKISASSGKVRENYIPSIKYKPINAEAGTPKYVPAIDANGNAKTGVKVRTISAEEFAKQTKDAGNTLAEEANTDASASSQNKGTTVAQQQDIKNDGTSWRGSGQFGKLDYTGEVTTYGTAYGQEMLAPEVNAHNIKVMLDHLRSLGYKIPESYDTAYTNFLADYKAQLQNEYNALGSNNNPFDSMFAGILDVVEEGTGLDLENLLMNSFDLMSRD